MEKSPLEIHFFDRDENYIKGLEWYASQMPETFSGQIAIEKSPRYFNLKMYLLDNITKLIPFICLQLLCHS